MTICSKWIVQSQAIWGFPWLCNNKPSRVFHGPCCAAALAYVTFCMSLHKQPPIFHIPALFLDSVVQRVLQKSHSIWHSVYILKDSQPRQVQAYYQKQDTGGARACLCGMEVTQSKMADGSGNVATRHMSMPRPLLTTFTAVGHAIEEAGRCNHDHHMQLQCVSARETQR